MAYQPSDDDKPKLTNDINFAFCMRRMNGKKLTRKEVVQLFLALISAWEEKSDEFLEKIYDENESVQFAAGEGDKIVVFGTVISDAGMLRDIRRMADDLQQAAKDAKATSDGGFGNTENNDAQNIPDNVAEVIRRLIRDNDLKHGEDE